MPKASFVKDGVDFKVGDQVLMRQGGTEELPYVARIDKIGNKDRKSGYELSVTWYYRPEDVGRRVSFELLFFLAALDTPLLFSTDDKQIMRNVLTNALVLLNLSHCSNITARWNYLCQIIKTQLILPVSYLSAQSGQ